MALFASFAVPTSLVATETVTEKYKPSLQFDVETGEFVVDGGGNMLYGSGYEEWVLWCVKTVSTERWAHLAYSSYIGTELISAFREPDKASQESAVERTISEALLADPMGRTVRVYDFVFSWSGDALTVSFKVLGSQGDTASISTEIK